MEHKRKAELEANYQSIIPKYKSLTEKLKFLLKELLIAKEIPIHSITSRTKTKESFLKKALNSKYEDPINEITDLTGARIIAYVNDDVKRISKIIEENFNIDNVNSIDKKLTLGIDKVGYISVHYIAEFQDNRANLTEYQLFLGTKFEIQIRTILQHAWAEIEHDKNYKFSGDLPDIVKRRFKILAGVLELADREFNELAIEIDKYSKKIAKNTEEGKLHTSINSTSLKAYLNKKLELIIKDSGDLDFSSSEIEKLLIQELKDFGINTLQDLEDIFPDNYIQGIAFFKDSGHNANSYSGILRDLMMISDAEKYFKKAWKKQWTAFDGPIELIESYNINIRAIMDKYGIVIFPPDDYFAYIDENSDID